METSERRTKDLRQAAVREVHRDDAVIISGAEYLQTRLTMQEYRVMIAEIAEQIEAEGERGWARSVRAELQALDEAWAKNLRHEA